MPQQSWRQIARKAIEDAVSSASPGADIKKVIDAAYPFGERKYHPYKIWLDERKKALINLDAYDVPKNRKCPYHPNGQTCLICAKKNITAKGSLKIVGTQTLEVKDV